MMKSTFHHSPLLIASLFFILPSTMIPETQAADLTTKQTFLKFQTSLFQYCQEEKVECTAFPMKQPEHLKAEQTVLLEQMVRNPNEDPQFWQNALNKVFSEVPGVNQAYEVLGKESAKETPQTHDQAVKWIIQNSKTLSEGLQKAKDYDENQAYSFAKINVMMKFVYEAFHLGTVNQSDLDAKYEFEKAGFAISNKLAASTKINK
jgi:hypothetical protein